MTSKLYMRVSIIQAGLAAHSVASFAVVRLSFWLERSVHKHKIAESEV